ncbi:MAG: FHA domain-containing protein [Hyphomicrobiaceae bacterium]
MAVRVAVGTMVVLVAMTATGLIVGGAAWRSTVAEHGLALAGHVNGAVVGASAVLTEAIDRAHIRTPAAVMVLAFGLTLPVVGLLLLILRWIGSVAGATPRLERTVAATVAPDRGPVWLEVERPAPRNIPLAAEIHRIGRDADSEITVVGTDIAETHALIRRTPEQEFHLIDVSGAPNALIEINGERRWRAALRDGDRIAVGSTVAVFHHGVSNPRPPSRHTPRMQPELRTHP